MLKRLKTIQFDYVILCSLAYLIKTLIISVNFADSIILIGLFSLIGFKQFLKFKEPKVTPLDEYKMEMQEVLASMVQAQKVSQQQVKEIAAQINNISSKVSMSGMAKSADVKPFRF